MEQVYTVAAGRLMLELFVYCIGGLCAVRLERSELMNKTLVSATTSILLTSGKNKFVWGPMDFRSVGGVTVLPVELGFTCSFDARPT